MEVGLFSSCFNHQLNDVKYLEHTVGQLVLDLGRWLAVPNWHVSIFLSSSSLSEFVATTSSLYTFLSLIEMV